MSGLIERSRRRSAAEKALFHTEGAGKSKIKRRFFGLSPEDERWIEDELDRAVDLHIQRDGYRGNT